MPTQKKPAPAVTNSGMIREGSPEGGPSVRFDPVKRANFHLNLRGERVYHEKPDGYRFDDAGALHPMKGTEEGESAAVSVDPHAGAPVPVEKES